MLFQQAKGAESISRAARLNDGGGPVTLKENDVFYFGGWIVDTVPVARGMSVDPVFVDPALGTPCGYASRGGHHLTEKPVHARFRISSIVTTFRP